MHLRRRVLQAAQGVITRGGEEGGKEEEEGHKEEECGEVGVSMVEPLAAIVYVL